MEKGDNCQSECPDILLNQVTFRYNREAVLEDVSLRVNPGEFIAIIGPNGGGKTTLLRLILGLLKPVSGRVRVFGRPPREVCHLIGYVPQHLQFDPAFPATVIDLVRMGQIGRRRQQIHGHEQEAAERALELVELSAYRNTNFASLSGGQRQRALIARALATCPRMLLFDEPTANVDSSSGERLYRILAELNTTMTVLVVSHDIGFVSRHITSVVCVNRTVVIHPTSSLAGQDIVDLYGQDISLVRHDHRCSAKGHTCSPS